MFQENPEKMVSAGEVRPSQYHFFGYLWEGMRFSNATLRCNTILVNDNEA
jgi:hypothetical protein